MIDDALMPFSTIGSTMDGPTIPDICFCDFAGCIFESDIWYDYTATCTGTATFSACNDDDPETGEADYDTRLVADERCDCPADNDDLVGCNDDGIGGSGFTSIMQIPVIEGVCYKIRLGG